MGIRALALALVWAASLYGQRNGQRKFNWQDYCFKNSAAPFCPGNDYAIKRQPPAKGAPNTVPNPFPPAPGRVAPSLIVIGGIDWRFADPMADTLAGFHFSGLAASPIARGLIEQLGVKQGVTEAETRKIFDALAGVDQVALSIRGGRIVALVTGHVSDSTLAALGADWKSAPASGNAILLGPADSVDQAVQRIATPGPPPELARSVEERYASSDFWEIGPAELIGPEAVSGGVKRFSLTVSMRDRFVSDLALEFDGAPDANTAPAWQTASGAATAEGNVLHLRMSMDAGDAPQKFGQIVDGLVGQRLATFVKAAKYLPSRETPVSTKAKPMIYGLDGGPREVNQLPSR